MGSQSVKMTIKQKGKSPIVIEYPPGTEISIEIHSGGGGGPDDKPGTLTTDGHEAWWIPLGDVPIIGNPAAGGGRDDTKGNGGGAGGLALPRVGNP